MGGEGETPGRVSGKPSAERRTSCPNCCLRDRGEPRQGEKGGEKICKRASPVQVQRKKGPSRERDTLKGEEPKKEKGKDKKDLRMGILITESLVCKGEKRA